MIQLQRSGRFNWGGRAHVTTEPEEPPIIIVGMPRSATTLVQNLLSLDPSNRTISVGEALMPVVRAAAGSLAQDRAAKQRAELVQRLRPRLMTIHPVLPTGPEECNVLEASNLLGLRLAMYLDSQPYLDCLLQTDLGDHYSWYWRVLDYLRCSRGEARWVLKSPGHAAHIPALARTAPNGVRIVLIRRDQKEVVASWADLANEVGRLFGLRRVHEADWSAFWPTSHISALTALDHPNVAGSALLEYLDVIADPIAAVSDLYDTFGLRLRPAYRRRMAEFVSRNPLQQWGRHVYPI
jgi:Sulfotransferase family